MRLKIIAVPLAAATLLCGCSVKEDRGVCPCFVRVDFTGELREPVTARFVDAQSGEQTKQFEGIRFDANGEMYLDNVQVPRREHVIYAWARAEKATVLKDMIVAQPGEEMDSVRTGSAPIDTRAEDAGATVKLNCQYCEIRVVVVGGKASNYPYTFRVNGKVKGVKMIDGSPVDGDFRYTPSMVAGRFSCNVPRQWARENTLTLSVLEDGEVKSVLPLGEWIANTGYNWTAESLVPVDITIDYAKAEIHIKVNDWGLGWSIENFEI